MDSKETLEKIDNAPVVFIASVSGFEIGLKHRAGKLQLPMPPQKWIREILSHHQIDIIDLNLDISLKATELPPIHKDLCDRFIIATALTKELPVVTAGQRFTEYGVEALT